MAEKRDLTRLPGIHWLSAKLSRKMVTILVLLAALGWLFSFTWLLHDIQSYTGRLYDDTLEEAADLTAQVSSFLEGSQGDYSGLTQYLQEHGLGCCLQDSGGRVVYQYMPDNWSRTHLTATSSTTVLISGRDPLTVSVWGPSLDRHDLLDALGRKTFAAMTLFNAAIFVAAGVLLYVLIVAPIISLRRTMKAYTDSGTLPGRSSRRDEVGRLQNSFADLIGLLRAKEQSEHRLIASISHDIKTPLTSVLGYSERLMSASLPPEKQEQYVQNIHDKGLAIKSIVNEFDDWLDAGLKEDVPLERITAGALCSRLREEYQGELADAGVAFSVRCSCPETEFLCNLPHMSRCFGNLIGNSIQHARAEQLALELTCDSREGYLVLEFSDNGVGVPPPLLQQIFEPLYTTDRGRKVSGLGLSICRSIIQSHGGSVTAANREDGGLSIRILLPIPSGKK